MDWKKPIKTIPQQHDADTKIIMNSYIWVISPNRNGSPAPNVSTAPTTTVARALPKKKLIPLSDDHHNQPTTNQTIKQTNKRNGCPKTNRADFMPICLGWWGETDDVRQS
jgi:hypothetical protein